MSLPPVLTTPVPTVRHILEFFLVIMKETAILFPLHIHLLVSNNPQVSSSYAQLITQSRLLHSVRLDKVPSLLVGKKETVQSIFKILFVFWLPWVLWGAGATL